MVTKSRYTARSKRKTTKRAASDVRSDSGYEVQSGHADAGGVNPRLQGPWMNRWRAQRKATRKAYKRAVNPTD